MNFFDSFPEFVELDTRQSRPWSVVSSESLTNRHKVSLPESIVAGKSVLDLGSCLGASGHWVLSRGCSHYTGVEIQPFFVKNSINILSKYWPSTKFTIIEKDIREFLKSAIDAGQTYDIIIVFGIIYAFLDTYTFIKEIAKIASQTIVFDSIYPRGMISNDHATITLQLDQRINNAIVKGNYRGAGARPSPAATKILMESCGFTSKEGLLYPLPTTDGSHDTYIHLITQPGQRAKYPLRYMIRFDKIDKIKVIGVGELVANNNVESITPWLTTPPDYIKVEPWQFDETVANRFQTEALTHIPDYQRVIDLCYSFVKFSFFTENKNISIVDVGSALGYTMETFIKNNYTDVWGIDNSPYMIAKSKHSDRVILSDTFPIDRTWDVIIANWTLHFIQNREEYISNMFNQLNSGGVLIITDKMSYSTNLELMYEDFKRSTGVSEAELLKKKASLQGILTTKPLEWYIETLKKLGATEIQVINTKFMFSTITAKKL